MKLIQQSIARGGNISAATLLLLGTIAPAMRAQRLPEPRFARIARPGLAPGGIRPASGATRRAGLIAGGLAPDTARKVPLVRVIGGAVVGGVGTFAAVAVLGRGLPDSCSEPEHDFCFKGWFLPALLAEPVGAGLGSWLANGRRGVAPLDVLASAVALYGSTVAVAYAGGGNAQVILPAIIITHLGATVATERLANHSRAHGYPRPAAPPNAPPGGLPPAASPEASGP